MKKEITIILVILLFSNLVIAQIDLENTDDLIDQAEDIRGKIGDVRDTDPKEVAENYLSREWTKIIRDNSKLNWIYKLDPLFNFLFGYKFALSWAFITALLIWLAIFFSLYPVIKQIFNDLSGIVIAMSFAIITSHSITEEIILRLSGVIRNFWYNLGLIILLIIVIYFLGTISSIFGKIIKKARERKRITDLESEAKKSRAMRKGVESMKKGAESMKKGSQMEFDFDN